MKVVFRVLDWEFEREGAETVLRVGCTCRPHDTTLCRVLTCCFPGLEAEFRRVRFGILNWEKGEIALTGKVPDEQRLRRVMDLLSEVLTVCDDADVSHCLSLYRIPDEEIPPEDWRYTEIGHLMHDAKYEWNLAAAKDIAKEMTLTIAAHPALSTAHAVTAMPSSGGAKHLDAPPIWSELLARSFGFEEIKMSWTRPVQPQKNLDEREQPALNGLEYSMDCGEVAGRAVIVLDDLYRTGTTMAEAVRALRHRGASKVLALCAVKTARGTQGGVAGLVPGGIDDD